MPADIVDAVFGHHGTFVVIAFATPIAFIKGKTQIMFTGHGLKGDTACRWRDFVTDTVPQG